ncbi:hypothetical protein [Thermosinus carboxydivorans]|uniref:hypothetical protein n=1 Tax=Thermosinus carboxydivorans TaxID=261685 RepID=UPI0002F50C21|nr:hypothetical protein [Thermosinus carboxydivorans]
MKICIMTLIVLMVIAAQPLVFANHGGSGPALIADEGGQAVVAFKLSSRRDLIAFAQGERSDWQIVLATMKRYALAY